MTFIPQWTLVDSPHQGGDHREHQAEVSAGRLLLSASLSPSIYLLTAPPVGLNYEPSLRTEAGFVTIQSLHP